VAVVSHYVACVGEESGTWCSDSGYSSEVPACDLPGDIGVGNAATHPGCLPGLRTGWVACR
jgi:hypothetical protein